MKNLSRAIGVLFIAIGKALIVLVQFLLVLVLGVILFILKAIPYLLRIVVVLVWLLGMWVAYVGLSTLYFPALQEIIQVLAITAAVEFLLVFIPIETFRAAKKFIWAGFLASGGLGALIGFCALRLDDNKSFVVASVAPILVLGMMLFYLVIRFKREELSG